MSGLLRDHWRSDVTVASVIVSRVTSYHQNICF